MWHDYHWVTNESLHSFTCHQSVMWHDASICVTWLMRKCDMSDSGWYDTDSRHSGGMWMRVVTRSWLNGSTREMTQIHQWVGGIKWVTILIHMPLLSAAIESWTSHDTHDMCRIPLLRATIEYERVMTLIHVWLLSLYICIHINIWIYTYIHMSRHSFKNESSCYSQVRIHSYVTIRKAT